MARNLHRLTDTAIRKRTATGRLGDGGGLWLNVRASGSKSWIYRWKPKGRGVREMGIGSYPAVSLKDARAKAMTFREQVARGLDPKRERDRVETVEVTFQDAVNEFLDVMEGQWSNAKHRQQWRNTLDQYCKVIHQVPVGSIELDDVLKVLGPIWNEKPETASRVRGRVERVLAFAQTKGWRPIGYNPASWRGNLENVLPKPDRLSRSHHAAMAWKEVPGFIKRLSTHEALAARALEFLIFTAARSGEVLEARWDEIDLDEGVWSIPAERMKARKMHRVPLVEPALRILKPLHEHRLNNWIFPGQAYDRPLSNMSMQQLLRRMKVTGATPHGFRSSFRDWAGDETDAPREVAEMCLAHTIGSAAEQAYRRSDALEKRRSLLEAWAKHCLECEK